MICKEQDKRFQQYLNEKAMLEMYGHVSSTTYEEWLEIKGYEKNTKSMEE